MDLRCEAGCNAACFYRNWQFAKDDDGLRHIINAGLADKGMPAFGAALNPEQITALIRFIRENESKQAEPARGVAPKTSGE